MTRPEDGRLIVKRTASLHGGGEAAVCHGRQTAGFLRDAHRKSARSFARSPHGWIHGVPKHDYHHLFLGITDSHEVSGTALADDYRLQVGDNFYPGAAPI